MEGQVYKPTNKEPVSDFSKKNDTNFTKTMNQSGVNLTETDEMLNEKEQSLKKKIFSLAKMESLVHSDPKLSTVYEDMAENGEERFGYHYNETIMNIIFNDYVLNSSNYLQKYKMAIPKKKKRRDKSGINQMKKAGEVKMGITKDVDETTGASSAGAFAPAMTFKQLNENLDNEVVKVVFLVNSTGDDGDLFAYFPEIVHNGDLRTGYSHVGQHSAVHPDYAAESREATPEEYQNLKAELEGMGYKFEVLNTTNETTAGGGSTGAYSTPAAWGAGELIKGKASPIMSKPIWKGGSIIQESDYLTDPSAFEKYAKTLNEEYFDDEIDDITVAQTAGNEENRNQMRANNYAEFRSSYDIPDGEWNRMSARERQELFDEYMNESPKPKKNIDTSIGKKLPTARNVMNEKAVSKSQQKFMGMVRGVQKGDIKPSDVGSSVSKAAKEMKVGDVKDFASTKTDDLPDKVAEEAGVQTDIANQAAVVKDIEKKNNQDSDPNKVIINVGDDMENNKEMNKDMNETEQSLIGDQPDSQSLSPEPEGTLGGNTPMGMSDSGLNENDILNEMDDELNAYSIHQEKLMKMSEDRKSSSMVLKDRLGVENKSNFKKDLNISGTKEIIDIEKELQYKDQQTDVKDPNKLGADIEKQSLKVSKGEALKNVGDSTNDKGDEIPKRNLTTEEQDEVDLYRKGLGDFVFDNPPSKEYEERMKKDMGEEQYKKRQAKMEFAGEAPMYNKDPEPMSDTKAKKVQFDKEQSGWNERVGIKESMVTGRYRNILDKSRMIDFRLGEATLTENTDDLFLIDFTGLGNSYNSKTVDNKVTINEGVIYLTESYKYYTDGKKIFVVKKVSETLNESGEVKKPVINEQHEKMIHLLGYKPNNFIDTTNIKKNRKF